MTHLGPAGVHLLCCTAHICRARLRSSTQGELEMRRRRGMTRKPAKSQPNIKAKRNKAAPPNRPVSTSGEGRKVARLARKGKDDPSDQLRLVIDTIPTLVWSC